MANLAQRTIHAVLLAAVAVYCVSSGPAWAETVLRRGNGGEPATLDPALTDGRVESAILRDLFEGLVTHGPNGRLMPGIADQWEVSPDGKRYTFHLRANAKWSDGSPLTADDVVYGFRRTLSPRYGKLAADFLVIENAADVVAGKAPVDRLGVAADGPQVVTITLNNPAPYFLDLLASENAALPMPKAAIEKYGDAWATPGKMIGNGAYRLTGWEPKVRVTVTRNPNFHSTDKVAIDEVQFLPVTDSADEMAMFLQGGLDTTYEVPQDQVKWIAHKYPQEFWNRPFLATYYYALNLTAEPFKGNRKLRRALSLAVDRESIVDKVTRAGEMPAYSLVPPTVPNYSPQRADFIAEPMPKRLEEARRLFAGAGFSPAQPLALEILYNTSENNRAVAEAVIAMWREAFGRGINVSTVSAGRVDYLERRARRAFQVVRAAWIGDFADPSAFLNLFLSSAAPPRNDPGYRSPQYDALLQQAAASADTAERADVLAKAERAMIDEVPIIPIYHYATKSMISPRLKGWVYNIRDVHPSPFLSFAD